MAVNLNRRGLLFGLLPKAMDAAVDSIDRRLTHYLRPPGALSEAEFLTHCTRCDACAKACPHFAIFTLTKEAGLAAHTPIMAPDEKACHMCSDFPCITACEPKALILLEDAPPKPLGYVSINKDTCFTFRGPECGACAGLCPTPVQALKIFLNKPKVDASLCIGCGLCIEACPTTPSSILFHEGEVDSPTESV